MLKAMNKAPTDGSHILLLVDNFFIEGFYCQHLKTWEVVELNSHGCGCCSSENSYPTGWMPLPKKEVESLITKINKDD